MDVTPQVINEVEFHQKMRGYDPDEVDDFLERVAAAVGQLHERVQEAEQRAAAAERRAAEVDQRLRERPAPAPAPAAAPARPAAELSDDEAETIKRTLVLAQKTADAAVRDAKEQAERTLQSAKDQAAAMITEAEQRGKRMVTDAEIAARKASEETRQRLVSEIVQLEEARDSLRADQGILERHLDEQRLRLRSAIGDLQRLLDDPSRLRAATPPELSGVTRPAFVDEQVSEPEQAAPAAEEEEPAVAASEDRARPSGPAAQPEPEPVIDLDEPPRDQRDPFADVDFTPPVERPVTGGVTFTPPDDLAESSGLGSGFGLAMDEDDTGAWSRFVEASKDRPTGLLEMESDDDDAYLAELRKAMLEDTSASVGGLDERRVRSRFGRRR